jgi:hypothetical protein
MQRVCNSWSVRNLLVMVLRLNKLAESMMSLSTRLLRPCTNFRPIVQCILHSACVVDKTREYPVQLPPIIMPNEVPL